MPIVNNSEGSDYLEIKCPFCKRNISVEDNYCPYCGYKVTEKEEMKVEKSDISKKPTETKIKQSSVPLQPEIETKPQKAESKIPIKEEEEIKKEKEPKKLPEKIPEEIIEQYYIRIKIKQYDEKLKENKDKINTFLSELNEQELEEIKDEIPKLKESIERIKQKRKELLAKKKPLPHEDLLEERKKIKKQLSNLKNKFHLKEIEPNVYEKLKQEYQSKLNKIKVEIEDEYFFEENWQKLLKKDIEKQEEQLDILEGRFKVGELSKKVYDAKINEINKKIEKLNLLLSELKI